MSEHYEKVKISAYIGFAPHKFDITESAAAEANITPAEFIKLDKEALNKTIAEILPWLVWNEIAPDGPAAFNRVTQFSSEVQQRGGGEYFFSAEDNCEVYDVSASWVDKGRNQVEVSFYMQAEDTTTAEVDVDSDNRFSLEELAQKLRPSGKDLDGDFDIIEVSV